MNTKTRYKYDDVSDIIWANKCAGGHYFDTDTMRFFRSRVDDELFGGRFFVTSEQFVSGARRDARRYTVREAMNTGSIDTLSEFGEFGTLRSARTAAKRAASALADSTRCRECDQRFDGMRYDDRQFTSYGYGPMCI